MPQYHVGHRHEGHERRFTEEPFATREAAEKHIRRIYNEFPREIGLSFPGVEWVVIEEPTPDERIRRVVQAMGGGTEDEIRSDLAMGFLRDRNLMEPFADFCERMLEISRKP